MLLRQGEEAGEEQEGEDGGGGGGFLLGSVPAHPPYGLAAPHAPTEGKSMFQRKHSGRVRVGWGPLPGWGGLVVGMGGYEVWLASGGEKGAGRVGGGEGELVQFGY